MDTFLQDLRYGIRTLVLRPAITLASVASLALGIGINSAIFTLVDTILLRPLPYPDPARVMAIRSVPPQYADQVDYVSVPDFFALKDSARSFAAIGSMYRNVRYFGAEENGAPAERIDGEDVTPEVLEAVGVQPLMGRLFGRTEDEVDHPAPVVIISSNLWRTRFGGDPRIIGRTAMLDGIKTEIIGVMPPAFRISIDHAEYWAPMRFSRFQLAGSPRILRVVGRLTGGATLAAAQAELDALAAELSRKFPSRDADQGRPWGIRVVPLHEDLFGFMTRPLLLLQGAVGFVMLIACANVAILLLARASLRQTEIAVRTAVGASRGRLIRQFLTESLLVGAAGGACGTLLAMLAVRMLAAEGPSQIPRLQEVTLDARALGFTLVVSALTPLVFGVAPAVRAANGGIAAATRGGTPAPMRTRLYGALVVVQVAMALVLLSGAGLLVRSLLEIQRVDVGGDPKNVLTFGIRFPPTQFSSPSGTYRGLPAWRVSPLPGETIRRMFDRVRAVPGVLSLSGTLIPPMSGDEIQPFTIDGRVPADAASMSAALNPVAAGYFSTMRIPILRGREFDAHETVDAPWVAIVNETMAKRYWPAGDAIGARVRIDLSPTERPREIIAVVRDAASSRLQTAPVPALFVPYQQMGQPILASYRGFLQQMTFVARTAGDPMRLLPAVQRAVADVDPNRPVVLPKSIEQAMSEEIAYPRYYSMLLGVFAAVAVALASAGLYGVMAHAVSERTREIGIRLALGAGRRDVLTLVLARALGLVACGLAAGLGGAAALTRFISSQLWQVTPTDPATFATVTALMLAVALAACVVPSLRAIRVDPVTSLRT